MRPSVPVTSAARYVPVTVTFPEISDGVIFQYRVRKLVALTLEGCFASTTETPIYAVGLNPLAADASMVIGEYSVAPVLSPIGKANEPAPLNCFLNSPPPETSIIVAGAGIVPEGPMLKKLEPKFKFPAVSVNAPFTAVEPLNEASPLDSLMVRW